MRPAALRAPRALLVTSLVFSLLVLAGGQETAAAAGARPQAATSGGERQIQGLTLAVDADPEGNLAASVGTVDACRAIAPGQMQVDIVLDGLPTGADLGGLQFVLRFDSSILRLDGQDWSFILASSGGAALPASHNLGADPDNPDLQVWVMGALRMGGAEIADTAAVAVRLTFSALTSGASAIEILPASPTAQAIETKVVNVDNTLVPIGSFSPAGVAVFPATCDDVPPLSPLHLSREGPGPAPADGEAPADPPSGSADAPASTGLGAADATTQSGTLAQGNGEGRAVGARIGLIAGPLAGGLLLLASASWLLKVRAKSRLSG